jgi:hypothetical protein
MKLSLCLLLLGFSQISLANDSAIFNYTGDLGAQNFRLQSSVSHTEYRTETESYSCEVQVQDGTETTCQSYERHDCHETADSERICSDGPTRVCSETPTYHTEESTCYNTVQVPYEVYDYDLVSNVEFHFNSFPKSNMNEGFHLTQSGESLSVNAFSSSGLIIKASSTTTNTHMDSAHGVKTQDVSFVVSFEEAKPVMAAVAGGLKNQKIEGKTLSFEVGDLSQPETFSLHLFAQRKRFIIKDITLIDRDLKTTDYKIVDLGNGRNKVVIDLEKLAGSFDRKKKHVFKFSLSLKHDFSSVVNMTQLGTTTLGDTITVND